MRAETSDAADPGGAPLRRRGLRSHPQQHPPRQSPPPPGRSGNCLSATSRSQGAGSRPQKVCTPASQPGEFGVPRARAPLRARGRGDGERRSGPEARGRRACVRGPAAVPGAPRVTQVMGARARPGSRCRRTAPSFAPGARSHPGTPLAPRARLPELPPRSCLPSPGVVGC